jgi:hypothetical protein
MSDTSDAPTNTLGVLWTAAAIAQYINVDLRKCWYLLETGALDADKIRDQWVTTKARLDRQFNTPRTLDSNPTTVADRDEAKPKAKRKRAAVRGRS